MADVIDFSPREANAMQAKVAHAKETAPARVAEAMNQSAAMLSALATALLKGIDMQGEDRVQALHQVIAELRSVKLAIELAAILQVESQS